MDIKSMTPKILPAVFIALMIAGLIVFIGYYFQKGPSRSFLKVSGRIEGREHNVGTKVAGRVDEIFIREGQNVEIGQPLAQIYSKQTEALLDAANARLKKASANLDLAKIEFERYDRLFKANAIAKMEYDYVENRYIRAVEDMVAAEKESEKMKADLNDTKIVAPISGTVVTKIVRKGEVIGAGTPLATVIDMDDLYLKVFLSTELAGKVSLNDEARIYPDAFPGEEFDTFVEKIGQKAEFTPKNVETKSQRAKLVFEIKLQVKDNASRKLKPGMPCDAVIKIDKNAQWKSFKR